MINSFNSLLTDWRAPMADDSEAARARRAPAPPPRQTVRPPKPRPRMHSDPRITVDPLRMPAPPRLIRPSEHLAIVERAMERRPPPLVPAVTVLHGPRPPLPPPQPQLPVYRHVAPPPLRMPAPGPPMMRPPPRRDVQVRANY